MGKQEGLKIVDATIEGKVNIKLGVYYLLGQGSGPYTSTCCGSHEIIVNKEKGRVPKRIIKMLHFRGKGFWGAISPRVPVIECWHGAESATAPCAAPTSKNWDWCREILVAFRPEAIVGRPWQGVQRSCEY